MQEPLAGIAPLVNVTFEEPWSAVTVPPQVVEALPETSIPSGSLSTSGAVRWAIVALGLFKVIARVETPPAEIVAGLNVLLSVGAIATGTTIKVATAGATLMPWLVCNEPAGSELK